MLAELGHDEVMETPFFKRIERDLKRSHELRHSLQELLQDVRRVNKRLEADHAVSDRSL